MSTIIQKLLDTLTQSPFSVDYVVYDFLSAVYILYIICNLLVIKHERFLFQKKKNMNDFYLIYIFK